MTKYLDSTGLEALCNRIKTYFLPKSALPEQTNNSGKFLSTNGTNTIWSNIDLLPSQTGNSGKFLSTNGTTLAWESLDNSEIKISSIHRSTAETTSITLTSAQKPASNIQAYGMSIYRNGIYLLPDIDYTYNSGTGVVTFNRAFIADEIISINFSYLTNDNMGLFQYEAGNNITFTENQSTGKTIISATQPDISGKANTSDLANVATSGSYNDLSNKPTIPDVSNFITSSQVETRLGKGIEKVKLVTPNNSILTLNPQDGSLFKASLSASTTIALSDTISSNYTEAGVSATGSTITLLLTLSSTDIAVSWPNTVHWEKSAIAPELGTSNIVTLVTFDNGTSWYGSCFVTSSN